MKRYAENRSLSLGKAVSDLVRGALATPRATGIDPITGKRVFDLPLDSPKVTTEMVRELDAEQ